MATPRIYGALDIFDEFIKGGVDVEFTGKNEIVLYTALNKTNTELVMSESNKRSFFIAYFMVE